MNKPSWFQPLDLFPLSLTAVSIFYALVVGIEGPRKVEATILMLVVAGLIFGIWGWFMWMRKRFLDSCFWLPTYGFMLDTENKGYLPPSDAEFDQFVGGVIRSWQQFHPMAKSIMKSRVKWIHFRQGMDEKPINPNWGLAKGITVAGGSVMFVDYDNKLDPIEKTALAHELGHVIHGLATGRWNQEEHHAFMKKNHLR